jgi:hypothetical protein
MLLKAQAKLGCAFLVFEKLDEAPKLLSLLSSSVYEVKTTVCRFTRIRE